MVKVYKGYEGDPSVPNGTREVTEYEFYCDHCGQECSPDDLREDENKEFICDECLDKLYPRIKYDE